MKHIALCAIMAFGLTACMGSEPVSEDAPAATETSELAETSVEVVSTKSVISPFAFLRPSHKALIDGDRREAPAYGTLARVCDFKKSDLGQEVARYPETGARYKLYDSAPESTGLRTHYVTGLRDGCALQFSAALATFGSARMYETMTYQGDKTKPFTGTAAAYEKAKARACGAKTGESCAGRRGDRFRKRTVFLTAYDRFVGPPRWIDAVIHDGRFLKAEPKGF